MASIGPNAAARSSAAIWAGSTAGATTAIPVGVVVTSAASVALCARATLAPPLFLRDRRRPPS